MSYGKTVRLAVPFAEAVERFAQPWPNKDSAFSPRSTSGRR